MSLSKSGIFAIMLAMALSLLGCHGGNIRDGSSEEDGKNITANFVKAGVGAFVDIEQNGVFRINSDRTFERLGTFQVGSEGGEIPYPTTCRYYIRGSIEKVYARTVAAKNRYLSYATHLIKVTASSFELDRSSSDNDTLANCELFERLQNARVPLNLNYYTEIIGSDHLRIHNSGGGDFKPGKPRTESTLDENFYREGSDELNVALKAKVKKP